MAQIASDTQVVFCRGHYFGDSVRPGARAAEALGIPGAPRTPGSSGSEAPSNPKGHGDSNPPGHLHFILRYVLLKLNFQGTLDSRHLGRGGREGEGRRGGAWKPLPLLRSTGEGGSYGGGVKGAGSLEPLPP